MSIHRAKTFQSGNDVAVRLPKELGIRAGTTVTIGREGGNIVIKPAATETPAALRVSDAGPDCTLG
jgi:virulence-associated protein VagC